MTKLPSDDELRDAFWTGYAAASWGEKEVSGMRACAALAIARMNERATPPAMHEAAIRGALDILAGQLAAMDEDCGDPQCVECQDVRRPLQRVVNELRAAIGEREREGGNMKRHVVSALSTLIVPIIAWLGGYNFDERGIIAVSVVIMMIFMYFWIYFFAPWWKL